MPEVSIRDGAAGEWPRLRRLAAATAVAGLAAGIGMLDSSSGEAGRQPDEGQRAVAWYYGLEPVPAGVVPARPVVLVGTRFP